MSVEHIVHTKEFEQKVPREIERTFLPPFPEALEPYRTGSQPIEQYYLSHPSEPFTLRLHASLAGDELQFAATLSGIGMGAVDTIEGGEITVPLSAELYAFYRSPDTPLPQPDLDPAAIVQDVLERMRQNKPAIVHIGGRSGSGKSTIVREVRAQLDALGLSSAVMSTDDYHRGNTWLVEYNGGEPWVHWDDPIVYDTGAMAEDLANLQSGATIYRREIDWNTVEPHFPGVITPSDVIVIEGIYARSPDITQPGSLHYEMTTPLATCIGRRLLRDLSERPEFANPVKSLGYMLTETEPTYRTQQVRNYHA